jgi:hypothetical protein
MAKILSGKTKLVEGKDYPGNNITIDGFDLETIYIVLTKDHTLYVDNTPPVSAEITFDPNTYTYTFEALGDEAYGDADMFVIEDVSIRMHSPIKGIEDVRILNSEPPKRKPNQSRRDYYDEYMYDMMSLDQIVILEPNMTKLSASLGGDGKLTIVVEKRKRKAPAKKANAKATPAKKTNTAVAPAKKVNANANAKSQPGCTKLKKAECVGNDCSWVVGTGCVKKTAQVNAKPQVKKVVNAKPLLDGCKPSPLKKYATRPSPPYPANECCGITMVGNDGNMYVSKIDKKGVCKWQKA